MIDPEREGLLRGILARPDDLTARLVYADWLDEHPELPAASATAEFIRVACAPVRGPWPMPLDAYRWLAHGWKRLIPSAVAMSEPITEPSDRWPVVPDGGMHAEVSGPRVDAYITIPAKRLDGVRTKLYSCRIRLEFGRGLLEQAIMPSAFGRERVMPALAVDQPQLFLRGVVP